MLGSGPLPSGTIAERFDMSWPTVTRHLRVLEEAGLVASERHGASIRYRLEISAAEEAVGFLTAVLGLGSAAAAEEDADG